MVKNWKQASIKSIAKLAGVGTASVDRVLNNRKGVSTNTKTKVSTYVSPWFIIRLTRAYN